MTLPSISTLQAASGRFLSMRDELVSWEPSSRQRCTELVRAFQTKIIDVEHLQAALSAERTGTSPSALPAGVAVLSLIGPLSPHESIFSLLAMGTSLSGFNKNLTAAALDPRVKAIVVICDTPGGSIRLVPEVAESMRRARARKPLVACVGGLCASAGFWIASNASTVESTSSGSIGSIGVIGERIDRSEQLAREGIKVHVFASSPYKAEGHEALPLGDGEAREFQRRVDVADGHFLDDVAHGRGVSRAIVERTYGKGRLLDARDALAVGMIDAIATTDDVLRRVVASPETIVAAFERRVELARSASERARIDRARGEIASHRERISAAVRRSSELR